MIHIELPAAFVGGLPGGGEILIVFVVLLLLFGSKRLPQIARTLGKTMEEFRKATREVSGEFMRAADETTDEIKTPALSEPSDSEITPEPTQAEGAFHRGTDLEDVEPVDEKQAQASSEPSDPEAHSKPIPAEEGDPHRETDLEDGDDEVHEDPS